MARGSSPSRAIKSRSARSALSRTSSNRQESINYNGWSRCWSAYLILQTLFLQPGISPTQSHNHFFRLPISITCIVNYYAIKWNRWMYTSSVALKTYSTLSCSHALRSNFETAFFFCGEGTAGIGLVLLDDGTGTSLGSAGLGWWGEMLEVSGSEIFEDAAEDDPPEVFELWSFASRLRRIYIACITILVETWSNLHTRSASSCGVLGFSLMADVQRRQVSGASHLGYIVHVLGV